MDILVKLAFDEQGAIRLLNWLAKENARIFRVYDQRATMKGEKMLPGLYESGVWYEPEEGEIWCDYLNLLLERHEDCDALASARAGELMARGAAALSPRNPQDPVRFPGDGGYATAQRKRLKSIPAEAILTTRTIEGKPGLYHVIVRYKVGGKVYYDDPSARLGMLGDPDSPEAQQNLTAAELTGNVPGVRVVEDTNFEYKLGGGRNPARGIAVSGHPGRPFGRRRL